jgi:hypothetical protein
MVGFEKLWVLKQPFSRRHGQEQANILSIPGL